MLAVFVEKNKLSEVYSEEYKFLKVSKLLVNTFYQKA